MAKRTLNNGNGSSGLVIKEMSDVRNSGQFALEFLKPYTARVTIQGTADIIFKRWNTEQVDIRSASKKGSKIRMEDDVESYVWRDEKGMIGIPGINLHAAITEAAKSTRDPRSSRKSARDLFKAGVVPVSKVASLGVSQWDYLDRRRVCIGTACVNRTRPAMLMGWKATFDFLVVLPDYIVPQMLNEVIQQAGMFIGLCELRPTYGRFCITGFSVLKD